MQKEPLLKSKKELPLWGKKPYVSLNYALQRQFGEKVYRLSLNGGMTCPNRDGKIGTRGCIFCSAGGSGDFAAPAFLSVTRQIEEAKLKISRKTKARKFIAYFQAYTNTYAPVPYLRKIFTEAICHPDIVILSVATRPDCLSGEVLSLLAELNRIKPVWIELGLQTIHAKTAEFIRRGFSLSCFEAATARLEKLGIPVIVHLILGLPGESTKQMLASVSYLSKHPVSGVKLQLLHILKGTDLETVYSHSPFPVFTLPEYASLVAQCIELLPETVVIHRLTGDGPKKLLLAPLWSSDKKRVMNTIEQKLKERCSFQGKKVIKNG